MMTHQKLPMKWLRSITNLVGKRQRHAQSDEHVGENRNHELEQRADHQHRDGDHRDRINESRLDRLAAA